MRSRATGGSVTCERWAEAISARLDGELAPHEHPPLDAHLAGCAACRRLDERWQSEHRLWRVRTAPAVPDLAPAVLAAAAPPRRRGRLAAAIAASAAAVAAFTIGLGVVTRPAADPPLLALAGAAVAAASRGGVSVLNLKVTNAGGSDRVVGATSPVAERTELHRVDRETGLAVMRSVTSVAVPAETGARFGSDDNHLMLIGLREDLRPGQHVRVLLRFARAGQVAVDAVVDATSTS